MPYEVVPLPFKPHRLDGLSDRMLVSHCENNYGGAVRRLNAIEERLQALNCAAASTFDLNGLGRERLVAANSMLLHEAYFDSLGGSDEPRGGVGAVLERDFGSVDRWHAEFAALGKALGGGSGWVLLTWPKRLGKLTNQWAADHAHTLAAGLPILALDMYEHAYAIDFGAKVGAYVDAFMRNIAWQRVETRLEPALHAYAHREATIAAVPPSHRRGTALRDSAGSRYHSRGCLPRGGSGAVLGHASLRCPRGDRRVGQCVAAR
jgi:Fe-Mn family superoxide dismutase